MEKDYEALNDAARELGITLWLAMLAVGIPLTDSLNEEDVPGLGLGFGNEKDWTFSNRKQIRMPGLADVKEAKTIESLEKILEVSQEHGHIYSAAKQKIDNLLLQELSTAISTEKIADIYSRAPFGGEAEKEAVRLMYKMLKNRIKL